MIVDALDYCPFCGGKGEYMYDDGMMYIECQKCHAKTDYCFLRLDYTDRALGFKKFVRCGERCAELWNLRCSNNDEG